MALSEDWKLPDNYFGTKQKTDRYKAGVNTAISGPTTPLAYNDSDGDKDFLEKVYMNEVGRASDDWGMQYWENELASGKSRDDIISAFNKTAEGIGYDNASKSFQSNPPTIEGATPHGYEPKKYMAAPKANVQGYTAPSQAQTQTYTATNQDVTPDQMSGERMAGLLASDSPYIQQARQSGLANAQRRGLLNSSLSAGAAEAAAIQAAMPLATQEAGVYSNAAANYANAQNRASEFGAQEENIAALQTNQQQDAANRFGASAENLANREYTQSENSASQFNAAAINRAGEIYASAQNSASITNANNELSLALQDMRDQFSTYSTDVQRSTALDNLGLNLFNTAISSGVFNNAESIAGYFNTVAGIFPDLGIQMISQSSNVNDGVVV